MTIEKTILEELFRYIPEGSAFICFASFEERCLSIPREIVRQRIELSYVLRNNSGKSAVLNESNYDALLKQLPNCEGICFPLKKSGEYAEKVFELIKHLKEKGVSSIVVDISTFTHECLLIILKSLYIYRDSFEKIILLYNGADRYENWLSKGCKDVRNVIGYMGKYDPKLKERLIVLAGFEQERIEGLVEMLEPDLLCLGFGREPTNMNHKEAMDEYRYRFEKWVKKQFPLKNYEEFEFSCSNVDDTIKTLNSLIDDSSEEYNNILVPLNTKISTVSAGVMALMNEKIQVCYPIPEAYNTKYADPSRNVSIISFKELDVFQS